MAGGLSKYHMTRVELKTFTFSSGAQSLYIDIAVLGAMPKRLLFTMIKNKGFLGTMDTNPFRLQNYSLNCFSLYVNGKQNHSGGLHLDMSHKKTSVMGYRTLFEASGIHHSNAGLQITHDMYVAGYFMLLFDLTPDTGVSEGHTSQPDSGNIRIELKFKTALPDAVTCLLYLEYDNCVRVDSLRTVTTDFSL
jgi:hypothetical protein